MRKLISFVMCLIIAFSTVAGISVSAAEDFEYERNFPCRKTYDVFRFLEDGYNSTLSDAPASFEIREDHSLKVQLDEENSYCRLVFDIDGENYLRFLEWLKDCEDYSTGDIEFEISPHGHWAYDYCDYEIKIGFTNSSSFGAGDSWHCFKYKGNEAYSHGSISGKFDFYPTQITNYFVVEISLDQIAQNDLLIPDYFEFAPLKVDYYLDCCEYEYYTVNTTHPNCTINREIQCKRCKVCGYDDELLVGIFYKEIDYAVPATCTKNGLTQGVHCYHCGEVLQEQKTVKATGHNYTCKITKKPTYFEKGVKTYTCTKCDVVKKKSIATKKPTIAKITKGVKKITIKLNKVKNATGYQIQIKKNGKWVKYTTKNTKYSIKNLVASKKYQIRFRAYKKQGKQIKFTRFSNIKTAKTK